MLVYILILCNRKEKEKYKRRISEIEEEYLVENTALKQQLSEYEDVP